MSYPTVFLILNLQNDLCHPEGVYAKHGLVPSHVEFMLPNVSDMVHFCKDHRIPVISSHLTIIPDLQGKALGLGPTKKLRPFLEHEGFRENSWGHDLLEGIPPSDFAIRQWSISPFYQTELDRFLFAMGTSTILISGFTTNGVVETCAREAIGRCLDVITLTDCVASYSKSLHEASLNNLSAFGQIKSSKEWMEQYTKEKIGT
jgi:ureidoacrylate peracid hydrolase